MQDIAIFGAKSIALGVCLAVGELYEKYRIVAFLVSDKKNNPDTLAGLPVVELDGFENKDIRILIATPEDIHSDIVKSLEERQFYNYICIDSVRESELMERYYSHMGIFQSLHALPVEGEKLDWRS